MIFSFLDALASLESIMSWRHRQKIIGSLTEKKQLGHWQKFVHFFQNSCNFSNSINSINASNASNTSNASYVMWCDVMWYDMMWCDVMWFDVMWCDVMWCDVMWCDGTSIHAMSMISHEIRWGDISVVQVSMLCQWYLTKLVREIFLWYKYQCYVIDISQN